MIVAVSVTAPVRAATVQLHASGVMQTLPLFGVWMLFAPSSSASICE